MTEDDLILALHGLLEGLEERMGIDDAYELLRDLLVIAAEERGAFSDKGIPK